MITILLESKPNSFEISQHKLQALMIVIVDKLPPKAVPLSFIFGLSGAVVISDGQIILNDN